MIANEGDVPGALAKAAKVLKTTYSSPYQLHGSIGYSRPEYHEPAHGGEPGSLVTAQLAGWQKPGLEEGFGGASNNFEPVYTDIPNRLVRFTYLGPTSHRQGPLRIRVGSMRGVGSPDNIFVAETFMDELAVAASADALEFRLRHKPTPRIFVGGEIPDRLQDH